jgi:3-dehydroquinate synthase II
VGVDGIVITPSGPGAIKDFKGTVIGTLPDIVLTPIKVTRIAPLSMGDRVCVDTCSLMRVGEGMLIGSQSGCLFLVQSEAMESEYVAARPFRVNAGAVHAYVLGSDGRTKYLSEVRGGDELMAIDTDGKCRPVVVGRAKVEVRPLLLLEAEAEGRRYSTILQNAETIRLCTPSGPVSVSALKVGQEVLARIEAGGRHFGHAIAETIIER